MGKDSISSFDIDAYYEYNNHQIIASGFHPPGGWFDAACCGSIWANHRLVLSDTTDYSIDQNMLCTYEANISNDQISLFYIGFIDKTTSVESLPEKRINCWYDEKQELIYIKNVNSNLDLKIELFDLFGSKIIERNCVGNQYQTEINVSNLNNGFYIVRLSDANSNTIKGTFKVTKR